MVPQGAMSAHSEEERHTGDKHKLQRVTTHCQDRTTSQASTNLIHSLFTLTRIL